jgi:hypothetical protein
MGAADFLVVLVGSERAAVFEKLVGPRRDDVLLGEFDVPLIATDTPTDRGHGYCGDVDDEPTERTEKGLEIPIPKRDDVITNFKKAAKPKPQNGDGSSRRPPRKKR